MGVSREGVDLRISALECKLIILRNTVQTLLDASSANDVTELRAAMGDPTPSTYAEVRALVGSTRRAIRIIGGYAWYDSHSVASDDGTNILVDSSGRRYHILTNEQFMEQLALALDMYDII